MPSRSIIAIFLILLVIAAAAAQTASESCSSRTTAYVRAPSTIRESPSHTSASVRSTTRGEQLDFLASQRRGPWCWLQVDDGWMVENGLALSAQPVSAEEPASTVSAGTTVASGGSCFSGNVAYISGSMNIRASATTSSAVSGSARAGDELAVSESRRGQTWCWLKVNRGWMAKTSRVHTQRPAIAASSGGSPAQTPVEQPLTEPVDNCCFVNRQCSTDQEWTDGYWAFQHGQCSAPSQGQTSPSASGDNNTCCARGWICSFDFDWIMGKWVFDDNDGWCPAAQQELIDGVILEGSPAFINAARRAMNLIKRASPQWYAYVLGITQKIRESNPKTGSGTLNKSFNLVPLFANVSTGYLAAIIVHETCHIHRSYAGVHMNEVENIAEEPVCDTVAMNARDIIAPGTGYPRGRIDDFLALGIEFDIDASARREWERAVRLAGG